MAKGIANPSIKGALFKIKTSYSTATRKKIQTATKQIIPPLSQYLFCIIVVFWIPVSVYDYCAAGMTEN